jgi:hypothetical protein
MHGRSTGSAPRADIWRFRPGAVEAVDPRAEARFRSTLVDALRSGQGLRPNLELALTSGSTPVLTLRTVDPGSTRWFSRVVTETYAPHQWELVTPGRNELSAAPLEWTARRIHEWPQPLGPEGCSSLLDRWVDTLRATPPGALVRIRAEACPARTIYWWTGPPRASERVDRVGYRGDRDSPRERPRSPEIASAAHPLFWRLEVHLEIAEGSPAARRSISLGDALSAASRTIQGNGITFHRGSSRSWNRPVRSRCVTVTLEEWATFWPGLFSSVGGELPLEGSLGSVLPFGRTNAGTVVGPAIEPRQGRHIAILGQTGMGKSSLLIALARRSFKESGGTIFDPLGDTVRSLFEGMGAGERARCLWISPGSLGVELNALEGIGGGAEDDSVRSERRLNDLVHALRRVRSGRYTDSGYWGPRLEEMVTRALRAASALPEGTLVDAHTLLSTSTRLGRPIPGVASEVVRELADRIRDRPEDADGARRLLHEVVRSPVLSRMLAAPHPTLRARDLVAPGRIVLISGDAARVGESTARYLLSVLLALVWSELLARAETPKAFVFLDEAQWFSHESLAEMLRLGRGKNVHVVLATQAIASLPEQVAESVWTNVSDIVAFRGSPEEAREMARVAPGINAAALLSLPRGRAAVLIGKGESVHWLRTARFPNRGLSAVGSGSRAEPGYSHHDGAGLGFVAPTVDVSPEDDGVPAPEDFGGVGRVLEEIDRIGQATPEADPFVVELAQLRRQVDAGAGWVRTTGSLLAREGALLRVERSKAGRCWILDRERFLRLCTNRSSAAPIASAARTTQPS